jgi:addiction module HigA family antidote
MVSKTQRQRDNAPAHPGKYLSEVAIPSTGKTNTEIAALLGVSRQALYDITSGRRAVTPSMAVRLGTLFGNGPELWLNMQQAYDLWHAKRALQAEVARMPRLRPRTEPAAASASVNERGR